ncbi:hypothetical protein AAB992_07135 [Burkholderia contaminans]|uniref:hypothetical protein n=1 Tax=Burkholderia contaminans TaxID=488447 RepID=UPI00241657B1|nr:hypothetical protein [Burkholderia contaminans]WFN13191.1 hypothetical protein LXE92_19700 [Burkholderia contaminans]
MSRIVCKDGLLWKWCKFVLVALIAMSTGKAHAYVLILNNLSNGYSGCSWVDNGNGTSTVSVTIDYKQASGYLNDRMFLSRGILVYTYNRNGVLNPSAGVASAVYMNGERHETTFVGAGYVMYYNSNRSNESKGQWRITKPFIANVVATISNSAISEWPAVGIRAGNFTDGNDVGEISGVAYIRRGENQGACNIVVDPEVPPPVEIKINMNAPDWNLGDLARGDSDKTFTDVANQLCFSYSGSAVGGRRFIINARNDNGLVANRYRLNNVDDASQYVPYSIKLDGGTSTLSLPNSSSVSLPFGSSGKMCFVPTFKTTVDSDVKEGNYNDVLTFTIITTS